MARTPHFYLAAPKHFRHPKRRPPPFQALPTARPHPTPQPLAPSHLPSASGIRLFWTFLREGLTHRVPPPGFSHRAPCFRGSQAPQLRQRFAPFGGGAVFRCADGPRESTRPSVAAAALLAGSAPQSADGGLAARSALRTVGLGAHPRGPSSPLPATLCLRDRVGLPRRLYRVPVPPSAAPAGP